MRVDFLKIDVEGAEVLVLRGGLRVIKRWKPFIIFEHCLGASDVYGFGPEDVYDLLVKECGLKIYLLSDWISRKKDSALDLSSFCDQFRRCLNYYFLACP